MQKGLELAQWCYETYGTAMLEKEFPGYRNRIAAGLAGEGSECFGYDDEISRDHDFGPGFCLWVSDETYREVGEKLSEAFGKMMEAVPQGSAARTTDGSRRRGVQTIGMFYRQFTGCPEGPRTWQEWLSVPDCHLAAAVNGRVFADPEGTFTGIRNHIRTGCPEDVWKKKIAARAVLMAQSGQYNYSRCVRRGDLRAAALALQEFVRETIQMCFLLERKYCPYYKWMFRALEELERMSDLADPLAGLLLGGFESGNLAEKARTVEEIAWKVILELRRQNLTDGRWDYLEPHAFEVMNRIEDPEVRSLHIMAGVS